MGRNVYIFLIRLDNDGSIIHTICKWKSTEPTLQSRYKHTDIIQEDQFQLVRSIILAITGVTGIVSISS